MASVSPKPVRIVVADDHQMFLEGVARLLDGEDDIEIVGHGANGDDLLQMIKTHAPDLALADLSMPGPGLGAILELVRNDGMACRIIALTMHIERSFALNMMENGLSGYVTKDTACSEVLEAIRRVASGETYLCQQIALPDGRRPPFPDLLTPREMQCLKLAALGLTNKAIAQQLGISDRTAKFHIENVCGKLDVRRCGEAVAKARAKGSLSELVGATRRYRLSGRHRRKRDVLASTDVHKVCNTSLT